MAYLNYDTRRRPSTMLTVHNWSFQGQFPAELLEALRLPSRAFSIDGVESYGKIGFLKAGLHFADRITTVSPSYAREIQTPAQGCGLDGLLRTRADVLSGIRNGIDIEVWNSETDPRIAARYGRSDLVPRQQNKLELQWRFGLEETAERLLFAVISRLAWQKGLDLLADAAPSLVLRGAQLAILGTGEAELEQRLAALAQSQPDNLGCIIGYDEDLSHLIQAGADVILVPSRFEPCGLTQLCAMRYGAIPLVAKVGGLADTVADLENGSANGATGIQFLPVTPQGLESGIARAYDLWSDKAGWRQVQANCMDTDVSWAAPADQYLQIYRDLMRHRI
jgi:starch synthase